MLGVFLRIVQKKERGDSMPNTKAIAIAEINDSVSNTNIDTIYVNNYPKHYVE